MAISNLERHFESEQHWTEKDAPASSGVFPVVSPNIGHVRDVVDSMRHRWRAPGTDDQSAFEGFPPRQAPRLRALARKRQRLLKWGELLYESSADIDEEVIASFLASVAACEDMLTDVLQDALLTDVGGSG